jgi:hypothetical protein
VQCNHFEELNKIILILSPIVIQGYIRTKREMVKLEKENSLIIFSTIMENAPQQSYEDKEIKGPKFPMKKITNSSGERAPLSCIDPNKHAQLGAGKEQVRSKSLFWSLTSSINFSFLTTGRYSMYRCFQYSAENFPPHQANSKKATNQ